MELFEKLPTLFASIAFFGLFREVLQIHTAFGFWLKFGVYKYTISQTEKLSGKQFAIPAICGGIAASNSIIYRNHQHVLNVIVVNVINKYIIIK